MFHGTTPFPTVYVRKAADMPAPGAGGYSRLYDALSTWSVGRGAHTPPNGAAGITGLAVHGTRHRRHVGMQPYGVRRGCAATCVGAAISRPKPGGGQSRRSSAGELPWGINPRAYPGASDPAGRPAGFGSPGSPGPERPPGPRPRPGRRGCRRRGPSFR